MRCVLQNTSMGLRGYLEGVEVLPEGMYRLSYTHSMQRAMLFTLVVKNGLPSFEPVLPNICDSVRWHAIPVKLTPLSFSQEELTG